MVSKQFIYRLVNRFVNTLFAFAFTTVVIEIMILIFRLVQVRRTAEVLPIPLTLPITVADYQLFRIGFVAFGILAIYISFGIFFVVRGLYQEAAKFVEKNKRRFLDWWDRTRLVAGGFLLAGFLGIVGGSEFFSEFFAAISPELFGLGFTVLIIDSLNKSDQDKQLKSQLIRELGSTDNGLATRAANELRSRGWLTDGSLHYKDLRKANLKGVNFKGADLAHVYLIGANLKKADLSEANLQHAFLSEANLQGADLGNANFQYASIYRANFEKARIWQADLSYSTAFDANFKKARLEGVNLQHANLDRANFSGASFRGISHCVAKKREPGYKYHPLEKDWYRGYLDADLSGASLKEAKNLTIKQLVTIKSLVGATLPMGISYEAWDLRHLLLIIREYRNQYGVAAWRANRMPDRENIKVLDSFEEHEQFFLILFELISAMTIDKNTESEITKLFSDGINQEMVESEQD